MGEGEKWGFIFYLCKSFTFLLHLKTNVLKTTCHFKQWNNSSTCSWQNQSYSDDLTVFCSCCKFMSFESNKAVSCYLDQKPFLFHSPYWIYHTSSALRGKFNLTSFSTDVTRIQAKPPSFLTQVIATHTCFIFLLLFFPLLSIFSIQKPEWCYLNKSQLLTLLC